eukprot:1422458-Rhodomonas_salina.1
MRTPLRSELKTRADVTESSTRIYGERTRVPGAATLFRCSACGGGAWLRAPHALSEPSTGQPHV